MLMPTEQHRDGLITFLREQKIWSVFHYVPLHLSPQGRKLGGELGQCPFVEGMTDRLIRLPFHASVTAAEQAKVVEMIDRYCRTHL